MSTKDAKLTKPADLPALVLTGRYQSWQPGDGVPVRTTVGYPRFWRHGPLVFVRELAPFGIFGKGLGPDEARRRYLDRLDAHAETIVAELAALARVHPGETLVLLCFENVHAGETCHRRWAAEWFADRYGIAVPELPPTPSNFSQPQLPL